MADTLMLNQEPGAVAASRDVTSRENFEAGLSAFQNLPAWVGERKREAFERFAELPMPTRKDEAWRFASVGKLQLEGFEQKEASSDFSAADVLGRSAHLDEFAGKAVYCDGFQVNFQEVEDALARQGVIWCSIEEAFHRHGDRIREYFRAENPELGSEKFLALHTALLRSGTFLYVPRNVKVELPLLAYHWTHADGSAVFPHTLVVAEEGAQVTMIDFFQSSTPDTRNLAVGSAAVFAGNNSHVRYKAIQDWNLNTHAYHLNTQSAGRDAHATYSVVNTGSAYCRNEQNSRITGENATVNMYSLGVTTGSQELDQRTLQTHLAGHAFSDLLYKNALLDESRSIFSGLIRVAEDAQLTDAYQTNRNLLLSDTAEANSLPGLEIEANDVKCSHGATTGRLSEEELFYLRARGIPLRKAQEMLVFGFFEEIIGKFENKPLAEYVRGLVQRKFAH